MEDCYYQKHSGTLCCQEIKFKGTLDLFFPAFLYHTSGCKNMTEKGETKQRAYVGKKPKVKVEGENPIRVCG